MINNAFTGTQTSANGEIDFTSAAVTFENIWFTQSGNDLVVQLLGSTATVTVSGWFGNNAAAQVQTFNVGGFTLDYSAVAQLVSATATYQASNSTFNPSTAAQMRTDATLQAAITGAWAVNPNGVSVATAMAFQSTLDASGGYNVVDTAANVVAGLAFLESDISNITSIALTDSTMPTLALTAAQYSSDTSVLDKIGNTYNLTVSGVTAANAATVAGNAFVTSITVSDTAAQVTANLAALESLATDGQLSSVTLTDSSTPTITLTAAQDTADAAVLAKITSSYNLVITGGGVAASAQATLNDPTTINLGNARVGATDSEALSISNTATAPAENLDASINGVTGNATGTGSFTGLAAGATDSTDIAVGLNTATVGAQSGSVTLNLSSDGTGIDSNGITPLTSQTVQVSGNVYREASASIASLPSNLIVHVGDTVDQTLSISNTAANDGYSENLTADVVSTTGGVTASGSTGDIGAQGSSNGITVGINTSTAGTVSGSVTLDLASDGGTGSGSIDGLGSVDLGQQTVAVNATVNNYANAAFEEVSGGGTLTQNGNAYALTLNLGPYNGGAPITATLGLGVLNNVTGPSDLLSGSFSASGSSAFTLSGLDAFSGLAAGQGDTDPTLTFSASATGTYTETITLDSSGSNASGYEGDLAPETLTVTVNVGQTFVQDANPWVVTGTPGYDVFVLTATPESGTSITGGTGTNTLEDDYYTDISPISINGVQTLLTGVGALTLTADQLSQFSTITTEGGGPLDLVASGAGTYDLTGKTLGSEMYLDARQTSDDVTLIAGSGASILVSGAGVDTLIGGTGNDLFYLTYGSPAGTTMTGGTGTNTLEDDYISDISQMNFSGMQTLLTGVGDLTLTAAQLSQFSTINTEGGGGDGRCDQPDRLRLSKRIDCSLEPSDPLAQCAPD